jgi:hypothetical protein
MKKLINALVILVCLVIIHPALADDVDSAKLKINISGPVNSFYLCTSNNGCSDIRIADKGREIMMELGKVDYIFASNMRNLTMSEQTLPPSCHVTLDKNQTLVVSGKLLVKDSKHYGILNLKCNVIRSA